jgi:hypothetical protein
MSSGPVDCNGKELTIGDVCRIVVASEGFEQYIGTFVTVVDFLPPGEEANGFDDNGSIIFGTTMNWSVYAESDDLPPCPFPGQNWLFPGWCLQKMFGPSVDLKEDTEEEKEVEDSLTT